MAPNATNANPGVGVGPWLAQFQEHLKNMATAPGPKLSTSPTNNMATSDLLSFMQQQFPATPSLSTPDNSNKGESALSIAGRVFDVLSRPLFGQTNRLDNAVTDIKNNPDDLLGNIVKGVKSVSPLGLLDSKQREQEWAGLSGKAKVFGDKIIDDAGWKVNDHPHSNNSAWNTFAHGLTSFGFDVGLDPLTYIPGTAVKGVAKGTAQGVVKGLEKVGVGSGELPKFGRTKNALDAATTTPSIPSTAPSAPLLRPSGVTMANDIPTPWSASGTLAGATATARDAAKTPTERLLDVVGKGIGSGKISEPVFGSHVHLTNLNTIKDALLTGVHSVPEATGSKFQKAIPTDFSSLKDLQTAIKTGKVTTEGLAAHKAILSDAGFNSFASFKSALTRAQKTYLGGPKSASAVAAILKSEKSPTALIAKSGPLDANAAMASSGEFMRNSSQMFKQLAQGDSSMFVRPAVGELHPELNNIVEGALKTLNTNLKSLKNPLAGATGQANMFKHVIRESAKLVSKTNTTNPADRAMLMHQIAMPMLAKIDQAATDRGIPLLLGRGSKAFPISMHNVLSSLDPEWVKSRIFTKDTALTTRQLLGTTDIAIRHALGDNATELAPKILEMLQKDKGIAGNNPRLLANELAAQFSKATPELMNSLSRNSIAEGMKVGAQVDKIAPATINAFDTLLTDVTKSAAEKLAITTNPSSMLKLITKGLAEPVSPAALNYIKDALISHVASITPEATHAIISASKKFAVAGREVSLASKTAKETSAFRELFNAAEKEGSDIAKSLGVISESSMRTYDGSAVAEYAFGVRAIRAVFPIMGTEDMRAAYVSRQAGLKSVSEDYARVLNDASKQSTRAQQIESFARLQGGEDPLGDSMLSAMSKYSSVLFSGAKDHTDSVFGIMARNGITAKVLNRKLSRFGVKDEYKLVEGGDIPLDLQWKTWEVSDPIELMSKYHAAVLSASADSHLGSWIGEHLGQSAAPGLVKYVNKDGSSILHDLLPAGRYYAEDTARQMHSIDELMKQLTRPVKTGDFLKGLETFMHSYKAGLTIWRVGHHIRNEIGDLWFNYMDGVRNPTVYSRAMKVLQTRKEYYGSAENVGKVLNAYSDTSGKAIVLTKTFKGVDHTITAEQAMRMQKLEGGLPSFTQREDIGKITDDISRGGSLHETNVLSKVLRAPGRGIQRATGGHAIEPGGTIVGGLPTAGTLHTAVGKASEIRDHHVRIAHYLDRMDKTILDPKFATYEQALEDASQKASQRVRKWHADGTDQSPWEAKWGRNAILFYSWQRKAIPLILEAMVVNPGRVMQVPKAIREVATANGIDIDTLGNPFPANQLFPSYLSDQSYGPQFGHSGAYMGIKPGIPFMDVANDYASGDFNSNPMKALQSFAGNINPVLKVPMELAAQHQVRTGAPIPNALEYLKAQIPNYTAANSMAGDPTQSKVNSQYQGNPTGGPLSNARTLAFVNWLTGMGISDYSKPSLIKSAQREHAGN